MQFQKPPATARFLLYLALLALAVATTGVSPRLLSAAGYSGKALLVPNDEYSEVIVQGIRNSRENVVCTFFIFKISPAKGNQPRRIAEELIAAKKRGVEVTVVLERSNGKNDELDEGNRRAAAYLSRGGVKVLFDSPKVVTHVKAVVIDDRYVYLGSHNLTQAALRHNNELSVLIDSPELAAETTAYLAGLR